MLNSLQLGISSVAFITDIVRLIYCLLNKERIITFDDKKNYKSHYSFICTVKGATWENSR